MKKVIISFLVLSCLFASNKQIEAQEYSASSQEELETVLQCLDSSKQDNVIITLKDGVTYNFNGLQDKHITIQGGTINISSLVGDVAFIDTTLVSSTLYCNGYTLVIDENVKCNMTLYGGSKDHAVEKVDVTLKSGKFYAVYGSYGQDINGDIDIEVSQHAIVESLYGAFDCNVAGSLNILYDAISNDNYDCAIHGIHGGTIFTDLNITALQGRVAGISPQESFVSKNNDDVLGNIHVVAGKTNYDTLYITRGAQIYGAGSTSQEVNCTVGGNVTLDVYNNVESLPNIDGTYGDIVGSNFANVLGDVEVNVEGALFGGIIGARLLDNGMVTGVSTQSVGNLSINAKDAMLRSDVNFDESQIRTLKGGYVRGDTNVVIENGSVSQVNAYNVGNNVLIDYRGDVNVSLKGNPLPNTVYGVWGGKVLDGHTSTLELDQCSAQLPIIGHFNQVNLIDSGLLLTGNENSNCFSAIDNINIIDSELTTAENTNTNITKDVVLDNGLFDINGKQATLRGNITLKNESKLLTNATTWIYEKLESSDSLVKANKGFYVGYNHKNDKEDQRVLMSDNDTFVFDNAVDYIYGSLDISSSNFIIMSPLIIQGDYLGDNNIYLPDWQDGNYPNDDYPDKDVYKNRVYLEIYGQASGKNDVYIVDYQENITKGTKLNEAKPKVGQNYIVALSDNRDSHNYVFNLANENSIFEGLYFKNVKDALDQECDMWQVALDQPLEVITIKPENIEAYMGGVSASGDSSPTLRFELIQANKNISLDDFTLKMFLNSKQVDAHPMESSWIMKPERIQDSNYYLLPTLELGLDNNQDFKGDFLQFIHTSATAGEAGYHTINLVDKGKWAIKAFDNINKKLYEVNVDCTDARLFIMPISDKQLIINNPSSLLSKVVNTKEDIDTTPSDVSGTYRKVVAQIPENAKFYTNGKSSGLGITGAFGHGYLEQDNNKPLVALLFDETVNYPNASDQQIEDTLKEYGIESGQSFIDYDYTFRYLDLVNVNDGNAWLTCDSDIEIYWPYPQEVLDKIVNDNYLDVIKNYDFKILHYKGIERNLIDINSIDEWKDQVLSQGRVEVENMKIDLTSKGIHFTLPAAVEGGNMSPFVMMYKAKPIPVIPQVYKPSQYQFQRTGIE